MHELAVTENILEIASRHANQAGAKKVTSIQIVIGSLSSIVDDSVQFYWEIISKESICEGSILSFNRIPAQIQCDDCNHTFEIKGDLLGCQNCGSSRIKVISGDEFYLESIEVEK